MEPNVEDAAVTPTDVPLSYPCFSIAGIKILPTPAVSAWEEPEIPAKIIQVRLNKQDHHEGVQLKSCSSRSVFQ